MIKTLPAIWMGKIVFSLTRTFKLGGGSAAPGHFALKLDKNLVKKLSKNIPSVVVTGTNGKTTTARLIALFAQVEGSQVLRNETGSNMERGIASKLIEKSNLFGKVRGVDLAVWEADEASFNKLIFKVNPQVIVFLNASRDQLDRYGEFDSLVREWKESLGKVDFDPLVLVNADDGSTYSLTDQKKLRFKTFGANTRIVDWEKKSSFKGKKDFEAKEIKNKGMAGFEFAIEAEGQTFKSQFPLAGLYHIYDLLAAFGAGYSLNLSADSMLRAIKNYVPAFGRVEKIKVKNNEGFIMLIKNPGGASQVFETIAPLLKPSDRLLLALNDNLADGTDVSWIWDARFEELKIHNGKLKIVCSGKRAEELALRLKYAGFDPDQLAINPDLNQALNDSLKDLKGRLFILPTYTALLELQKILAKKGVKKEYWKEDRN